MPTELTRSIEPDKLRPWHEHVIDMLIANPNLSQREIATRLGRSEYWLSIVVNSDAFQNAYKARKEEIVNPLLSATVEQRLTAVASKALDKLMERLETNAGFSNKELISAVDMSTKALGMGPVKQPGGPTQNLYIVPAPAIPATSAQWVAMAQAQQPPAPLTVENGAP